MLDAVDHAHSADILHRDVKPSNVVVRGSDGQPILVDFGLSYVFEGQSSGDITTRYVGSIGFIPEEVQANPRTRTRLHDIYSCAAMAYQLCTGQIPKPRTYSPLATVDESLAALDPLIVKGLAPAAGRFQSAKAFADELRTWKDRSLVRSRAGVNPYATQLRTNLIQQRNAADERRRREDERRKQLEAQWATANDLVTTGARLAFEDVAAQLAHVLPGSAFTEVRRRLGSSPTSLTELLRFDNGKGTQVILALSTAEANGTPVMGRSVLLQSDGRSRQSRSFIFPYWAICRLLPQVTQHAPDGTIALTESNELIVKPLTEWHGNMGTTPQTTRPLVAVDDVRAYVTKAIGAALHLDRLF